tara:strand:- start:3461 stop:6880 length:3420 start_codon:yes stop_codon:yes gene_type:complete
MSDFVLPKNVDQFMADFEKDTGKSFSDAVKEKVNPDADADYIKEYATNKFYKKLSDAQTKLNLAPPNYLMYYKAFNPTGQYANAKNYRAKNQDVNKSLKNLSDGEIANKVYDQFKQTDPANMPDFEPWINDWAPKYGVNLQLGGEQKERYTKKELIKLSGSDVEGIDTDMLRLAQSLAFDEETASRQLKIMAGETFGVNPDEIEFRKNPKSNALEFLNPETKRYQVVNAPGLDIGDFYSIAGDLMVAIPEVVGGVVLNRLNALRVGPPVLNFLAKKLTGRELTFNTGAGIGSFVGAATGELMRVQLGNLFFKGMNPEITDGEVLTQAGQAGIVNALFTKLGLGAVNTVKFFQKGITFGKSKFNDIDFKDFNLNTQEATDVANIMNRKMEEIGITRKVKFNIAEASNDMKLKQSLAALESDPSVGIEGKISKMRLENAETFVDFFKTGLPEGALIKQNETSERMVGEFIQNAMKKGKSGDLLEQKKLLNTSKANLEKRFDRMDKTTTKKVDFDKKTKKYNVTDEDISFSQQSGMYIRSAIDDVLYETQNKYTKKFAKFGDLYGDTPIGLSQIDSILGEFDQRKAQTLFKNFTSVRSLFDKELMDKGSVSMKYMMNTISDLKSFQRDIQTGLPGTEGVQVGQIKRLIGAIDKQMKESLGEKSVAFTKYKKLINDYADDMKKTNGALSKILEVKGGVPVIANEDVFQQTYRATLPGKEARIDTMMEIMKTRPRVLTNFKQNILKDYKQQVFKNGKFDLQRHKNYIADENYGYALKKVFGAEDFGKISKVGGLIKNVENAVEAETLLIGKLKKATNGLIENNDPATVFKKVYNVSNPEMLKDVVKILRTQPNNINGLKKVVMDDVLDKTTDADGHFMPQAFKNYFKKGAKSQGSLFNIVYGDDKKYIDNIQVLRKAMDITMRKAPARDVTTVENWLNHVIRSRVGVFTPEGRALTAITAISQNAYKKRLASILADPDKVAKLASLEKMKLPKELNTFGKIEDFLKKKQAVTQIITDVFGYVSDTYPATGAAPAPTDMDVEKELIQRSQRVSSVIPEEDVKVASQEKVNPQVNTLTNIVSPTNIDNNLFAEQNITPTATQNQAPVAASKGIKNLNPQTQAQNFAGLFPQDTLGQAIAQRGNKIG